MRKRFWPLLRNELWKVLHSRALYVALALGVAIQLYNVCWNVWYVQEIYEDGARHAGGETRSLFILWLSAGVGNIAYYLFRTMLPLLALLPYGWSFVNEANSGYRNLVLSKVSRKGYFTAKYLGSFVSGMIVVAVPLCVNLLLNAMVCPAVVPSPNSMVVPVNPEDVMYLLFYSRPWLYSFLWIGISALWGGVLAGTALLISQVIHKTVFVLLLPCVLVFLLSYVMGAWALDDKFLIAAYWARSFPVIFGEMGILTLLSYGGGLALCACKEPV